MRETAYADRSYSIDRNIATCAHLVYSYDRDVEMPIAFVHYAHRRTAGELRRFHRKNDFTEIFIFIREGLGFIIGDTLYTPAPGDAIIIGEDIPFSVTFDEKAPTDLFPFDYYEIILPRGITALLHPDHPFSSLLDKERSPLISLPAEKKRTLFSLLGEAEGTKKDPVLYAKLVLLADMMDKERNTAQKTKKIPQVLSRAMQFISEHYTEIDGAQAVAEHLSVSTTYLSRLFGHALGCTTTEYLCRLRIFRAKELLMQGQSVTEACYASGFNSYTYFISRFKHETGMTPAKFRASGS